jgi:hypothetical protein
LYEQPKQQKDILPRKQWLWVGAVVNGETIDVTERVNLTNEKYITPGLLAIKSGLRDVEKWLYLDPKTFEQRQFPSDVFIIENDPTQ